MNLMLLAVAVIALASSIAYAVGFRRGKAVGWCEHHFADIARDRARRHRNGQFKPREASHA